MTYAEYFQSDSAFEEQFRAAAGNQQKQEEVTVDAVRLLGAAFLNIKDLTDYGDIPDKAMDKWAVRLDEFGIKRGIPVGGKREQFYKECDM